MFKVNFRILPKTTFPFHLFSPLSLSLSLSLSQSPFDFLIVFLFVFSMTQCLLCWKRFYLVPRPPSSSLMYVSWLEMFTHPIVRFTLTYERRRGNLGPRTTRGGIEGHREKDGKDRQWKIEHWKRFVYLNRGEIIDTKKNLKLHMVHLIVIVLSSIYNLYRRSF